MNKMRIFDDINVNLKSSISYGAILTLRSGLLPTSSWLTAEEWQWLSHAVPKRQQTFAWGRAALRWLCSQLAGVDGSAVSISLPSDKEPEIWVNHQQWHCSVSHSHSQLVVIVNQTKRVAVDLEYYRTDRLVTKYQDVFPLLQPYCTSTTIFYRRWTLLEAMAKYYSIPLLDLLIGVVELPTAEVRYVNVGDYLICVAPADIPICWYQLSLSE
ncbi:MAG: hypothetical protein E6Q75_11200 [Rheinheimera sp.]|nr:MAG: hypothetical protein E6Q75_11200 [Rheinheimera sp.]